MCWAQQVHAPWHSRPRRTFEWVALCCAALCDAVQAVVATIARLYRQFRVALEPGQVPLATKQTFALVPAQGLRVRFHRRA